MARLTKDSISLVEDMMSHLKFWLRDYPLKEIKYFDNRFLDKTQSFCITVTHEDGRVQCLHEPVDSRGLNARMNAEYFKDQFNLKHSRVAPDI